MTDRGSRLLCWTGWTDSQPVHPVDKKSQIWSESSYVIKEANKRNSSQFRARSENQTKKDKCSSWLTEAASYGAEPVEPVPNRFSRLVKNPKFGQKVPKWLRKQTKETVLNFEPGWVRTGQRKTGVPHGWQRQPTMVLNRLNRFPTGLAGW